MQHNYSGDAKILEQEILSLDNKRISAANELRRLRAASAPTAEIKKQRDLLIVLNNQSKSLKDSKKIIDDTVKSVDKYQLLVNRGLTKGFLGIAKIINNLPNQFDNLVNKLIIISILSYKKYLNILYIHIRNCMIRLVCIHYNTRMCNLYIFICIFIYIYTRMYIYLYKDV